MDDREHILREILDFEDRRVVLLARVWERKVTIDHPEVSGHLEDILGTVAGPDHFEMDPRPSRERFYKKGVEPSNWLLVVVSYEQEPARIITALATRKDPKLWQP